MGVGGQLHSRDAHLGRGAVKRAYEHPGTYETIRATSPEHAAARIHGGKASDYTTIRRERASIHEGLPNVVFYEAYKGLAFIGDIYLAD